MANNQQNTCDPNANSVANHVKGNEKLPDSTNNYQLGVIISPLTQIATQVAGGYETTAPVKIPDQEELTVRLVNISQIQRLDELRSDATLMQTILWSGIGAILGFFTNVVTSNQPLEKYAILFLILLIGITIVFAFLTKRASRREQDLRRRLFDDKQNSAI